MKNQTNSAEKKAITPILRQLKPCSCLPWSYHNRNFFRKSNL